MYTSESKVREISGFQNATNITPSTVRGKITTAQGMVNGALAGRYTIPIPYHRQNLITFSGTGTGSGTLTAVVNGSNYAIAITNGMTSEQAADLMAEAMYGNDDFITEILTDNLGNDSIVVLISKTDSATNLTTANAEINITNAGGTVQGIVGTAGTRQDRYPPFLDQVTAEIAAALLLSDNFGAEAEDTGKDGRTRMEEINGILLQLQDNADGKPYLKIMDEVTGEELSQSANTPPVSFPNDASNDSSANSTAPKATMNQIF